MKVPVNFRVEVTPWEGIIRRERTKEWYLAQCESLKRQITKHVENAGSVTIAFDYEEYPDEEPLAIPPTEETKSVG